MYRLVKSFNKHYKKMRTLIVVGLLSLTALALGYPKEEYADKYDNVNLDEILSNRRLLVPYIKCALEVGKCSADGKEMKEHIKDAMVTNCGQCTEKQKKNTRRVIKHMIVNEKDYWDQIKAKYDPESKYYPRYEELVSQNSDDFFSK